MPVQPPDPAELDRIARLYGPGLSEADIASFRPVVDGLLASWDAVDDLYQAPGPELRVAHTFEKAVGGFPTPRAAPGAGPR